MAEHPEAKRRPIQYRDFNLLDGRRSEELAAHRAGGQHGTGWTQTVD